MGRNSLEQMVHFLSDMYSVELQALVQLESAPDVAGSAGLAADLRTHYAETQDQAATIKRLLEDRGGSSSSVKEAVMKLGGKSFLLFAQVQPETPGRLLAHAYSYEAMEWAGYAMLIGFAEAAGDAEVAESAREIQAEERTMMERLEGRFDAVETASESDVSADELHKQLRKHLAEAHALESQSIQMLKKAEKIAGDDEVSAIYRQHLDESRGQAERLEQRVKELGGDTSTTKDAMLTMGAMEWGMFFQAQSDTPAKLAAFVYALEHLEIGGYELLRRVARRAGDAGTAELAESILSEERAMCERLEQSFATAVDATLQAVR